MTPIFAVVQDAQDAPFVIGPLDDGLSDELYAEIEGWGWTIITGYAPKLTLAQARRKAATDE